MSDVPPTSADGAPPVRPEKPAFRHALPPARAKRAFQGIAVIVVLAIVAVAAATGYGWYRFNQIDRKDLALSESAGSIQNFLIVGSDSRSTVDPEDPDASAFLNAKGADQGGQRSDTIMVARIDPNAKTIDLISFPRDLWVPIQPSGSPERINTAYAQGKDATEGAQRLIDTIKVDFGIEINHYVEINFKSFKGITDAVGGVSLYFEKPVRDRSSGFYMYDTGCQTLTGEQGIAYARSRHLEYYSTSSKKWIEDPSADLGRISRQTLFMRTIVDKAQTRFGDMNVKSINDLISSTADNLSLDTNLSLNQMMTLAKSFKGFGGDQIRSHALPVYPDMTSGGASVLRLDAVAAEETLNIFRGLPPGTVSPSSVTLSVSNGSGTKNQATEVSARFAQLGYKATPGADATKTQTATVVRYAPGLESQAGLVARQLSGGAQLQPDKSLTGARAQIVLVTGSDFTGVLDQAAPLVVTTTTTSDPDSTVATTTTMAAPVVTIKPGEVTELVGVLAGEAPEGTVCN